MERFLGRSDYKITFGVGVSTTGTSSGTSDWMDLGEYAEQVDLISQIEFLATNNSIAITAWQNSTSTDTGSSTLSVVNTPLTTTGQTKERLQTQFDNTALYPWLGPVDGRYVQVHIDCAGTNTTGTTVIIGALLTIASREYPVE